MRIAAGVLLIIAAVFNGIAGLGYFTAGGAGAAANQNAAEMAKQAAVNTELTAEQIAANAAQIQAATQGAGWLLYFGIFLLVMLGLQIAGGVVLFQRKAANFALVVGVLGLAAEGLGVYLTGAVGVTNILGIVASLLAIIASRGYAGRAVPAHA